MIGAIKDSWLFSKVSRYAMERFNVNFIKADKATDGLIHKVVKRSRELKLTVEETAATCVLSLYLTSIYMSDYEINTPDYFSLEEIKKKLYFMFSNGEIREPVWEDIRALLDECYKEMRERLMSSKKYPESSE